MKATTFLIFLILFTGISCSKDIANDHECLETRIQGEWLWIKTEGGFLDKAITPENAGYTQKLEIDDTFWREFTNDSLIMQSLYIFHADTSSINTRGWIEFQSGSNPFVEISGCKLTLICGFEDCPTHTYERKQ